MAVARITDFDADPDAVDVAITTDATRQALAHLTAYLDAPPARGGRDRTGTVVAVLGDYGTGKTHLAVRLVRHARQALADPTHALYLDATAESFIELYRRFMQKLGREGVRAQVSEYYADIVADSLQSSGLTSDMLEWLGSRQLEPQEVVERLGLMESALLRKVQDTLREVTNNKAFGTALTLLLRPGFEHAVWSWLLGGTPDQVLVERGIATPIDTEVAALEAMGVFALLFGGRQRRFVLAVDELDKIFSADSRPHARTMAAFQTLLQVFAKAGACLVLCGLPDFKSVLPPAVRQRIPYTVVMSGLSQGEVREFIALAQEQVFGSAQLAPFTVDTTRYLRDIARGNARNVIRLCHRVFRMADDLARTPGHEFVVTEDMVRQAARDLFGSLSSDDIDGVVRRLLDANGLDYLHRHLLGAAEDSLVDFWVTFPDRTGGCAVLLTRSLLDNADVSTVMRRISAVREADPDAEIILLVNGVVADGVAIQLRELLGREPLVYVERTFADDFKALVGAMSARLDGDSDPLSALRLGMDRLARQQSSIYGFIEQLAEHMDGVRASSDRQLGAIQRQLGSLAGTPTPVDAPRLPGEVERLFRDAVDALEDLTQVDVMFQEAFDHAPTATQEAVHRRLRMPEFTQAAVQAEFMRKAVQAFRGAVSQWYQSSSDSDAEDRLDELCGIYDGIVEFLPLFLLDPLFKLPPWSARTGTFVAEVNQSSRRTRVHEALSNLSPRVRRAVTRESYVQDP
jgi:Cdc6-like AAA superfamily ATPase